MHELLSDIAQTWGLLIFIALFAGALVYALWPRNQARFDKAARNPLDEPDTPAEAAGEEDPTHVRD